MAIKIEYIRFFAINKDESKCFNAEFKPSLNIIYGKNTSGKSTLIQSILYTFGINSEKNKLKELIDENLIFRLDFKKINSDDSIENCTIIRDDEILVSSIGDQPIKKFTGISGDSSREHIDFKKYLNEFLGSDLHLEMSKEYKIAPIEALFLPYYIAQDTGWNDRHKSFRGLDYVKNFKKDFFDYYLGIENNSDRTERIRLEEENAEFDRSITFLNKVYDENDDYKISELIDEKFEKKTIEYLEPFKKNKEEIIKLEKEYLVECNKLSFLEQRKTILNKINRAIKKQNPIDATCPTCEQYLPNTIEQLYEHFQNENDTENELKKINADIKTLKGSKSKINSLKTKIQEMQSKIDKDYSVLCKYTSNEIEYETWLDTKTDAKLSEKITSEIKDKEAKKIENTKGLEKFKTSEDIEKERNKKNYDFAIIFKKYLKELGVKEFDNEIFSLLYKIPTLPKQGVELLKTIMAYNFAFNDIISKTIYVHRLPFLMDAIFEGDFENDNKELILKFISKNHPKDTQNIFSIADSSNNKNSVIQYNKDYFNSEANLICIGKNENERAFLSEYDNKYDEYLEETFKLLE